jgi:hypothetical protein
MKSCPWCAEYVPDDAVSCSACARPLTTQQGGEPAHVVVTDVRMPFWSMVVFMVKWAIASIPAAFIIVLVSVFAWAFAWTVFMGFMRGSGNYLP